MSRQPESTPHPLPSDVMFLDVNSLRKLRPTNKHKRFDHSFSESALVKQAPLIDDLRSLADPYNSKSPSRSSSSSLHPHTRVKKKVKKLKTTLHDTKKVALGEVRKVQRLELELEKAEILHNKINQELLSNAKRVSPSPFKNDDDNDSVNSLFNTKLRKHKGDLRGIASAIRLNFRHVNEMFELMHKFNMSDSVSSSLSGVKLSDIDDVASNVIDDVIRLGRKLTVNLARKILMNLGNHFKLHEVDMLISVCARRRQRRLLRQARTETNLGCGAGSPSTTQDDSNGEGEGPDDDDDDDDNGHLVISGTDLIDGILSLRLIHFLAQVEGGEISKPHRLGSGTDEERRNDAKATVTQYNMTPPRRASSKSPFFSPPHPPDTTTSNNQIEKLRSDLLSSSKSLHGFDRAVKREVALVSQSYVVSQNTKTKTMSQLWCFEKLETAGKKMITNYLRLAFTTMKRYIKYKTNQQHAISFVKSYSSRIVGKIFVRLLHEKYAAFFREWREKASYEKNCEETAAVLELQAAVRMKKGIKITQVRRENFNATQIQRIHRGNGGRIMAVARKTYLRFKWAASVVENAWINLSIIRNAKRIVRERKEDIASRKIQTCIRIFMAARRVQLLKDFKFKADCCIQIQSLYRGYYNRCMIYDENDMFEKYRAARRIQTVARMFLAFMHVEDVRERDAAARSIQKMFSDFKSVLAKRIFTQNFSATKMQSLCRAFLAKKAIARKRRWVAAQFSREARSTMMIQAAFRSRQAQKRILLRKESKRIKEKDSAMLLQRMARGRKTRVQYATMREEKRMSHVLEESKRRASIAIQGKFRQRKASQKVKYLKKAKDDHVMGSEALKVQRSFRGMQARRRTSQLRKKRAEWMREKSLGRYFILQREYMLQQEKLHGDQIRMIQGAARVWLSVLKVKSLRGANAAELERAQMNHAALVIQNKNRQRAAKLEVLKKKQKMSELEAALNHQKQLDKMEEEREQRKAATKLQGRARGRRDRARVGRIKIERQENDGACKVQSIFRGKLAKKKVATKREEKRIENAIKQKALDEQNFAATRLQAVHRGNSNRKSMAGKIEDLRKKKEQHEAMVVFRCAVRLQCGWRKNRAKKYFKKKKKMHQEELKQRKEDEELERNLDALHREQEMLLYVLRVQNCYRNKKAREKFSMAQIARMQMSKVRNEELREVSCIRIQAYFRGQKGRRWMVNNWETLKRELEYRSYCVECMNNFATRRCTTCLDRYCDQCWGYIHAKGRKRQHAWDVIEYKPPPVVEETQEWGAEAGDGGHGGHGGHGNVNGEWAEHWDDSANASYYYNSVTGEASWVRPW